MRREVKRAARRRERQELAGWQKGAVGLLLLAVLVNMVLFAMLGRERKAVETWKAEYQQAETARQVAEAKLADLAAIETQNK